MRNILFTTFLIAMPFGLCLSQSSVKEPVEPTAIGVVYQIDSTTLELKRLPNEQSKEMLEPCGFGKGCSYIMISGGTSSFRVKGNDKMEFTFQTGSPEKVSIYKFEFKKKNRQFLIERMAPPNKGGIEDIKGLPADVSKYGKSSYKLTPISPLTTGEYAIVIAGNVYTFGVD